MAINPAPRHTRAASPRHGRKRRRCDRQYLCPPRHFPSPRAPRSYRGRARHITERDTRETHILAARARTPALPRHRAQRRRGPPLALTARFAALAIAWRGDPPPGDIAAVLEQWRVADRKLWEGQEHGRRRALAHRDDLYRQVGALLAAQAAHVVVDDINIAAIAGSQRTRDEVPTTLQQAIDRRRHHAAPSRLRDAIASAARRSGGQLGVVAAQGLSRTHAACGHENPADDRYAAPPVTCDGCGVKYDPDASATLLMLRAAGAL